MRSSSFRHSQNPFFRAIRYILLLLVCLAVPLMLPAQNATSTIFGTVTDPTGALVPNAQITAHNVATGVAYPTTTNGRGSYRITQLPPGSYTLEVKHSGFAAKQTRPFTLVVGESSQQNVALATGAVTQTVSVTASSVLLNTESSSVGQIIQNQQIEQLPLNGRDFLTLTSLSPGVTPVVSGISSPASAWTGTQTVSVDIGGLREDDTSYLVDGIETRNAWYGADGLLPSVDAVQEFRLQQVGSSAAFDDGAAFVSIVTRSGTNQLHGTAYEFLRNNDFDARNFFDSGPPPPFHQNQFGAALGGPILRNKMFFFLDYEGFRLVSPSDDFGLVPTPAEISGDFSALSKPIVNPYTGVPYPGNRIPTSDQNPIGIKTLAFFPQSSGSYLNGADNFFTVANTLNDWNQGTARFDWNLNASNSLFVRFIVQNQTQTRPGFTSYNAVIFPSNPKNVAVGWTHTFSPNIVNTLHAGWSHTATGDYRADGYDESQANPLGLLNEKDQPGAYGPPSFGIAGYLNPGSSQGTDIMREGLTMVTDQLMMQHGKHQISVGLDIRYEPTYFYEDWAASSVDFNGIYTGNSIADVLVGIPDYAQTAFGDPTLNMRRWYQGYYVQDNWHALRHLNINAGLLWGENTQPYDTANHVGTFDLATGQDLTYPATKALGLGRAMVRPDRTDWQPRLGFNWDPFGGNTDIKGGAGIYFTQANMNQYEVEVDTTQYYLVDAFSNSPGNPPAYNYNDLWSTSTPGSAPTASFINPDNRDPYVYEFNLAVDHTIGQWLFEGSYMGTLSHRFEVRSNMNPVLPSGQTINPAWNGIQENLDAGNSSYNSVFGRVQRRFSNGLSMQAAYTYSKCYSDPWQDMFDWHPLDLKLDWGHCSYSIDHNFTGNVVYDLPFGRGRRFLNRGGWANAVFGGWELSGIATAISGAWLTLGGVQNLGLFVDTLPNVTGPVNNTSLFSGIGKNGKLGPLFNTNNVVAEKATGVQGNAGVQNIASPGWQNYDVSASKTWRFRERAG
ncbi:MAG: carboxypeptidase regulatory-like domain-containing protein, partial [Terriglobia bacterium]